MQVRVQSWAGLCSCFMGLPSSSFLGSGFLGAMEAVSTETGVEEEGSRKQDAINLLAWLFIPPGYL